MKNFYLGPGGCSVFHCEKNEANKKPPKALQSVAMAIVVIAIMFRHLNTYLKSQ